MPLACAAANGDSKDEMGLIECRDSKRTIQRLRKSRTSRCLSKTRKDHNNSCGFCNADRAAFYMVTLTLHFRIYALCISNQQQVRIN